ncbi:MAG: ROK family protein [Acidimicrobiales bacterium]
MSGFSIGVDIGGSKVLAVRLSRSGHVEAHCKRATPPEPAALLRTVLAAAGEVVDEPGAQEALPLGVGCPGMVDLQGKAHFSPNLHGVDGFDLRSELVKLRAAGARTVVFNDATAACWAERALGAAQGADDVVMVTMGTGIGGGLVMGGHLVTGAHGFAGEVGHMVVDPYGPPCPCGKRGCWERFASGSGLARLAREAALAGKAQRVAALAGGDPEAVRSEHLVAAALEADPEALAVVEEFAWWLGLGLANLANAFDPSVIVLGGGLAEAGGLFLGPTRRTFLELVEAPRARQVAIELASFGERAGAVGAALLAADDVDA